MISTDDAVADSSEETPRPTGRGQWHRLLGKLLELLLTPVGITVQTEVQVMSESPRVDVVLLRCDEENWTERQLRLLCDGLRNAMAKLLMVEFKYSESLNKEALVQALSYDYFYRQTQQVREDAVECFVMVARTPHAKTLAEFGYRRSEQAGVYRTTLPAFDRVTVIVLNELSDAPHNAFVQLFASRRQVRNSAFARLEAADKEERMGESLWELLFGLQGRFNLGEGAMSKGMEVEAMTPEMVMKLGRVIRQAVIASLTPEERLAGLAPEEVEQIVEKAPVEKRLAGLRREELNQLMAQIEAYLQQQDKQ